MSFMYDMVVNFYFNKGIFGFVKDDFFKIFVNCYFYSFIILKYLYRIKIIGNRYLVL